MTAGQPNGPCRAFRVPGRRVACPTSTKPHPRNARSQAAPSRPRCARPPQRQTTSSRAGSQAAPSRPRSARAPSPTSWWRGEKVGVFASPTEWGRREHPAVQAGAERRGLSQTIGRPHRHVPAPRPPPPALAPLGHPPPLREGGEKLERRECDSSLLCARSY